MKFELRGVRTDFPPKIVQGKTREAFIAQWSKTTWPKAPVDVREDMLGKVWDMLTNDSATKIDLSMSDIIAKSEGAATALKELDEATEQFLNTPIKPPRKSRNNGLQADTKETQGVRPDAGNGGDSEQQASGDNEAE